MVREEHVTATWIIQVTTTLLDDMKPWIKDRHGIWDPMCKTLDEATHDKWAVQTLKGYSAIRYAWDARGDGLANTVTPDGWKKFGERLDLAEQALTEAWKTDPTRAEPCIEMMRVELGQGLGQDREELWFKRALAADPDNNEAYSLMLYYLQPKWHGSPQAMIDFGRRCLEAKDWRGDGPFELVETHRQLAQLIGDPDRYFAIPMVWQDIQSVYQPYLKARPANSYIRSSYCNYACRCGQWAEARKQFEALGDNALPDRFGGKDQMERLRAHAMQGQP